jgi:hypothetical protein
LTILIVIIPRSHASSTELRPPPRNQPLQLQSPIYSSDFIDKTTLTNGYSIAITMKFSLGLITLLLSSLVASEGLSFSFGGQKPLGDGAAVPGDNPLSYCKAEHGDDLLILDHVNLTPNPPEAYVYFFRNIILLHKLIGH